MVTALGDHADHIRFYADIYDSNVTPGKTSTDMDDIGTHMQSGSCWRSYTWIVGPGANRKELWPEPWASEPQLDAEVVILARDRAGCEQNPSGD